MARLRRALLGLCVGVAGCASTRGDISGAGAGRPPCEGPGEPLSAPVLWGPPWRGGRKKNTRGARGGPLSALVLWAPQWRANQKDPAKREAAAQRGIEAFFGGSGCFARSEIRRGTALSSQPAVDRVIVVTVRELGPVLRIGLPTPLEGGTEVSLDVKVLDPRKNEPLADLRTHWQNGGAFVIRGTWTL